MTVELVTGFADTPHIDAADDGALNAAVISDRNHVLGTPSQAVMRDSNHLTVPTMEALFLGRHVRVTSAEDVTITSGSQGLKRHDIVGFRYSRDPSTNVETVVLDVIRGTASSTPVDPALPSGNILTGDSSAFMPLYRVTLDGINVGTPVPLFNVLRPMRELWTSADQIPGIKSQISSLQSSANQLPGIKSQISNLRDSVTQSVEAGTQDVSPSALGAVMFNFKHHHDSPPAAITATISRLASDDSRSRYVLPTVWDKSATDFQLRFYRQDIGGWVGAGFECVVSWIAVWNV